MYLFTKSSILVISFNYFSNFIVFSIHSIFSHIRPPSMLKIGCDYSVFKSDIKPMWEDITNKNGGRWLIKNNSSLDQYWMDIVKKMFNVCNISITHVICFSFFSCWVWLVECMNLTMIKFVALFITIVNIASYRFGFQHVIQILLVKLGNEFIYLCFCFILS